MRWEDLGTNFLRRKSVSKESLLISSSFLMLKSVSRVGILLVNMAVLTIIIHVFIALSLFLCCR